MRRTQRLADYLMTLLMIVLAVAVITGIIVFITLPTWSECLSKNSFLLCAAVLGGH